MRRALLAQSVSLRGAMPCPELGVKPTSGTNARTSHFDPQETSASIWRGSSTLSDDRLTR